MPRYITKCLDCEALIEDENPQTDSFDFSGLEIVSKILEMEHGEDKDGAYMGCPNCHTDGCLIDITDENKHLVKLRAKPKRTKKADRIKFVGAAEAIIKKHLAVEQKTLFDVDWKAWEVDGKLRITLSGEKEHTTLFSVFIHLLDEDKNFKANGKCNFHDSPGDVETSILRFETHLNTALKM